MSVTKSEQKDQGMVQGIQRPKLVVYEFYRGTGNHTEVFPFNMRELVFSNDSEGEISVQIIGPASLNTTVVLLAGEVIDERLPEFTSVVVTAAGLAWRFYTRSGEVT